jgi:predicted porin
MTSKLTKAAALGVLSLSTIAAAPARADMAMELLELLKAKGAITQAEYKQLKARHDAELRAGGEKAGPAEAKTRQAEAKARQAEANAREAEAKARQEELRAADMRAPLPTKAPPVQYVTVLPNCVGMRVGAVDICVKGDISFFGIEHFPDKNAFAPAINGGLATALQQNSSSIRGGLLPSSIQVGLTTHQMGIDVGAYFGVYTGGVNVDWGAFGANDGGFPVSLGTAGIDFRQVYGTLGTPTFGTVKIGRDIGIFAADAILNDLTLLGSGTPAANFKPTNTTLGRIGIGYLYTDFIPQVTYTSPDFHGVTFTGGGFTPYSQVPFSGDFESATMTGHDVPGFQGRLKYVGTFAPDAKLTLSTSGIVQNHKLDCPAGIAVFGGSSCLVGGTALISDNETPNGTSVTAWAVDGFGRLDIAGFSFVAYGYTGKGVGTTGLFFDGVSDEGASRRSDGGYLQASYTFFDRFTLGGSWGISTLHTADAVDGVEILGQCLAAPQVACLVRKNESAIGFVRYKLTDWVKLQAEYVHTIAENQINQKITDNAIIAGTTFFW